MTLRSHAFGMNLCQLCRPPCEPGTRYSCAACQEETIEEISLFEAYRRAKSRNGEKRLKRCAANGYDPDGLSRDRPTRR